MTSDALRRYKAFWHCEETDRPVLHITVPKYASAEGWEAVRSKSLTDEWENAKARLDRVLYQIKHSSYYAEGFATERAFFGSVCLAGMMGCDYKLAPYTVWFGLQEKLIKDWRDFDSVELNKESPLFLTVKNVFETFAENLNGQFRLGMTDLGGNLDILSPLRGTQELLIDLIENPEEVKKAIEITDRYFEEAFDYYYSIFTSHGQKGMSSWMGIWCDERYFPLQCDFAAMISPDSFKEFTVPSLTRACDYLDYSIFHLDGPAMLPHIDHLLSIEALNGIQWVPGDGNPPAWDEKWFNLYHKIQAANKSLVLLDINSAEQIIRLSNELSPNGLFISANLATDEEAMEVVGKLTGK